jgi:phage baseplate assembly protein W
VGSDGRIAWSEGETNIREAIRIILQTEEKERINLPTFGAGLQKYLFEPNTVATQTQIGDRITKALQLWEPRISLKQVDVQSDPSDLQAAIATISYKLVATQVQQNLNVTVKLGS